MTLDESGDAYIDVQDLRTRGWTEMLIETFLGPADRWASVDHWANFTGKRTYSLRRVEQAEGAEAFATAYEASLTRRKADPERRARFLDARASQVSGPDTRSPERIADDKRFAAALGKVVAIFDEARARGYRTPHKG